MIYSVHPVVNLKRPNTQIIPVFILSIHPSIYHVTSPSPSPNRMTPCFLLSANHLSIHTFIFALLAALPTLTVGTTLSILNAQQNIVNSLKLLCSEYGTPKHAASRVLPRCGTSCAIVYRLLQFSLVSTVLTDALSTDREFGAR